MVNTVFLFKMAHSHISCLFRGCLPSSEMALNRPEETFLCQSSEVL